MSVFILENYQVQPKFTKEFWIKHAVEFNKVRGTKTAKKYAEENNLKYSTMTSAFSKYRSQIALAIKADSLRTKSPKKMSKREKTVMLINQFRAGLRTLAKQPAAKMNNKSREWFEETLRTGIRGHKVSRPQVGKIYAYVYDAKHKDTLEYWDKFPLIIYLGEGVSKAGNKLMYGLNLHYIPPKVRQTFLEELLKLYSSTDLFTNKTKLKIDWSKVKGIRGTDLMIKAYLPSHVKTTFVEIKPKDWINIIYMPLHQFMSKGKRFAATKVWSKY